RCPREARRSSARATWCASTPTPSSSVATGGRPDMSDDKRAPLEAPIRTVTLLEDRAQITRRGKLSLAAGIHRLTVAGASPVIQDVALRARVEGGGARVSDVRVRREMLLRREDKPEQRRLLEERADEVARR